MDTSELSAYALLWLTGIWIVLALALSLARYVVARLGGCIPGKISCR